MARVLDKMTGYRSPAKTFADRFGGSEVGIPAMPQASTDLAPEDALKLQIKEASDLTAARRANAKLDGDQRRSEQRTERNAQAMESRIAQEVKRLVKASASAKKLAEAAPVVDPAAVPSEVAKRSRELMKSVAMVASLRDKAEGTNQAEALAVNSPLINEVGGLDAVRNPEFAKSAGGLISAANAIKKLTGKKAKTNDGGGDALSVIGEALSPSFPGNGVRPGEDTGLPGGRRPPRSRSSGSRNSASIQRRVHASRG